MIIFTLFADIYRWHPGVCESIQSYTGSLWRWGKLPMA